MEDSEKLWIYGVYEIVVVLYFSKGGGCVSEWYLSMVVRLEKFEIFVWIWVIEGFIYEIFSFFLNF